MLFCINTLNCYLFKVSFEAENYIKSYDKVSKKYNHWILEMNSFSIYDFEVHTKTYPYTIVCQLPDRMSVLADIDDPSIFNQEYVVCYFVFYPQHCPDYRLRNNFVQFYKERDNKYQVKEINIHVIFFLMTSLSLYEGTLQPSSSKFPQSSFQNIIRTPEHTCSREERLHCPLIKRVNSLGSTSSSSYRIRLCQTAYIRYLKGVIFFTNDKLKASFTNLEIFQLISSLFYNNEIHLRKLNPKSNLILYAFNKKLYRIIIDLTPISGLINKILGFDYRNKYLSLCPCNIL